MGIVKLVPLRNISCEYHRDSKSFSFHWRTEEHINCVAIARLRLYDDRIDMNWLFFVDPNKQNSFRLPVPEDRVTVCRFLLVGLDGVYEIPSAELEGLCCGVIRNRPDIKLSCYGLAGVGTVKWNFTQENGLYRLHLTSTVNLEPGILFYTYDFCGVKFRFPIPGSVEAGAQSKEYPLIYLPRDAVMIRVEAPGTGLTLKNERDSKHKFIRIANVWKKGNK